MAEWSIAAVLKTVELKGSGGSNPSPSASQDCAAGDIPLNPQRRAILQSRLPFLPWADPQLARLPGLRPISPGEWFEVDDAYAAQMALREGLLHDRPVDVLAMTPPAEAPARELLALLVRQLGARGDFRRDGALMVRPDGARVAIDPDAPLKSAASLIQEDLAILTHDGSAHCMTGAVVCFPAFWTLAEKIGRPLSDIHAPVAPYDSNMARRVERIFGALRVGEPVMRANFLVYDDWHLHQPAPEGVMRTLSPGAPRYVRVERQTLQRLPQTGAIVFAIHTWLVGASSLAPSAYKALLELRPQLDPQ